LEVLERAAYAQAAQGNAAKALALYEKILLNDSTHFVALLGAGFIYQQTGAWEKAIPYYMELVREDPKSEHYHSLAHCYAQQNEGGKTVIFLGQATSLYGESDVSDWLSEAEFDPVRETVEFRSFVDRVVGIETRKAIEEIRLREKEKENEGLPSGVDLPAQPELQLLKPGR
ncbi:MAG: tetratricopeptide repeat protein, partial [Victivallales bacterium]|nr:tetratricopeptide repeat protein [Victivallales bacterium]